jgi:phenylpyruvate tautomerase PptA (4-oxalocrotonate tautomerase family)
MEKEQIIKMTQWLQDRVKLGSDSDRITIVFEEPSLDDFTAQGFSEEDVNLTLRSDWWKEMAADIIETPDFAQPDESPEQVLKYARDLVVEYISKRLE